MADEYDAAQQRGEVRGGRQRTASNVEAVGAADIGLSHKDIHEARQIRDAEEAYPGIVRGSSLVGGLQRCARNDTAAPLRN